jgi:hypothetical protein
MASYSFERMGCAASTAFTTLVCGIALAPSPTVA